MGRKRLAKNKGFPPNLYQNPAGYFYYRDPITKKQIGLGRDRSNAFFEARAGNEKLATRKKSSVVEWMEGKSEYTLAEWLPIYSELWAEKTAPKPSTLALHKYHVRRLGECDLAPRRLTDITTAMIAKYVDQVKSESGATTATAMRSRLSDMFRWAETQGLIEAGRSPVTATRAPKVTVTRERMSLEQFEAIRDQAPIWLRNAMNLALVTGQRREDVLTVKFADWRDGRLYVAQGKSNGRTRLALDGALGVAGMTIAGVVKACRDLIASRYIVHHVENRGIVKAGNRINGDGLSYAFVRAREAAGIKEKEGRTPMTFHEIRSLSERLYREQYGADLAQAVLGHKSADMTARYDDVRGEWKVVKGA